MDFVWKVLREGLTNVVPHWYHGEPMTTEQLDALKWQLEEYGLGLPTDVCRSLIAEVERLQAFADLACNLYPVLSYEWEAMEEGV